MVYSSIYMVYGCTYRCIYGNEDVYRVYTGYIRSVDSVMLTVAHDSSTYIHHSTTILTNINLLIPINNQLTYDSSTYIHHSTTGLANIGEDGDSDTCRPYHVHVEHAFVGVHGGPGGCRN